MKITSSVYQILLLFIIILPMNMVGQHDIISLWNGKVPNTNDHNVQEIVKEEEIIRISNVSEPTLEVFIPARKSNIGKAVIICPGGGYKSLSYDWEGTDVAKWFNSKGISAFVLKYRLPEESINTVPHEAPLQDAQRAIRWIRQNASAYEIDPNQIGIMGFSAGGHLAASLGTHFSMANNFKEEGIDTISARPDFLILLYPVISMSQDFMHKGSKNNLIGKEASEDMKKLYSLEFQVSEDTPTTFIVHSTDDQAVPVENSLAFYKALKDNSVKAEMHIYPSGGHGYGLAIGQNYLQTWPDRLYDWLMKI